MEIHDVQPNSTNHHGSGVTHPVASIILYALSWLFIYLETLSMDLIWTWIWRSLSLISLLLIIYINWNKAIDIFRNKKNIEKK